MYSVQINGFKTKKMAEEFYHWYEGQGEQDIGVWWEIHGENEPSPLTDMSIKPKWKGEIFNFTVAFPKDEK